MQVLVIDDHPLIHEIMPAVLARALGEVAVNIESTLEAGLARAAAEAPDLVLLDLGLPGCEGLDSIARFRMHFPELPVAVISADSDRELILGALDHGAAGYIPKTSKPDVMIAALKTIAAGGTYIPLEASASAPAVRTRAPLGGLTAMAKEYVPPDPTEIEPKPEALDYWARTLEIDPEKIRKAVQKVGPMLETVKKELGIGGV